MLGTREIEIADTGPCQKPCQSCEGCLFPQDTGEPLPPPSHREPSASISVSLETRVGQVPSSHHSVKNPEKKKVLGEGASLNISIPADGRSNRNYPMWLKGTTEHLS